MKITTELQNSKQKALIVTKVHAHFITLLKNYLSKFSIDVFISPELPDEIGQYSTIFFINETHPLIDEFIQRKKQQFIFIFFHSHDIGMTMNTYATEKKAKNIKIITLETSQSFYKNDLDTILWFTFSGSEEIYLHIYHPRMTAKTQFKSSSHSHKDTLHGHIKNKFSKKNLILFIILFFILSQLLFIPPLLTSSYLNYKAAQKLQTNEIEPSKKYASQANLALQITQGFYSYTRPILLLFSVALYPEDLIQVNKSTNHALNSIYTIQEKSKPFMRYMFLADKTADEENEYRAAQTDILKEFDVVEQEFSLVSQKLPTWNTQLRDAKQDLTKLSQSLGTMSKILPHIDTVLARNGQKTYLMLFANNMELRPGGGFIGSFGIMTATNGTVTEFKIYDVYDADGQLEAHVAPPEAIARYLDQPHWFLRDSAFSPDFYENYQKAVFFLEKELGISKFDGAILLTTTTIQNLLSATGDIYIPDYRETVNKDNFYIKAQLHAEKDFFPGSLQKKKFLSSVMDQLMIEVEQSSPLSVFQMFKKSLDEKQMVMYFDDPELQRLVDEFYWSGRTITPKCAKEGNDNCIVDYLFPVDANLGVNKANFFITRPMALAVNIDKDGFISNTFTMKYKNSSYADVFPGGRYKNYFQILLPPDAIVKEITINGTLVEEFDQTRGQYRTLGFLMEIPPQSSKDVVIKYDLPIPVVEGNGLYQLILQKQVGTPNSDFQMNIKLPSNIHLTGQNFSPIVNDGEIVYNTSIVSDKIFIIEFIKE